MVPVKIAVKSINNSSGEDLLIETFANGEMTEKNGKYYAFYNENNCQDLAGTKTTLKWDFERLIIIRRGSIETRQEFSMDLESQSIYRTQYLTTEIVTKTDLFKIVRNKNRWDFHIEYYISIGGESQGKMHLKIVIEEDIIK